MPLGIDLEPNKIRIVQIATGDSLQIQGAGSYDIPYQKTTKRIQKMTNIFRNHSWPNDYCCLGLSGRDLNLRSLTIPGSDSTNLDKMVYFEAKQFLGNVPIEEFHHKYQTLPYPSFQKNIEHTAGATESRSPLEHLTHKTTPHQILLGLLRKERFQNIEECLQESSLTDTSAVPKIMALFRYYQLLQTQSPEELPDKTEDIRLLAHVSPESLDLCLIQSNHLIAAENGGGRFAVPGLTASNDEQETNNLDDVLRRTAQQISTRMFSMYESIREQNEPLPVTPDHILMTGSLPRISQVTDACQPLMDTEISVLPSLNNLSNTALPTQIQKHINQHKSSWNIPLGLALLGKEMHNDMSFSSETDSKTSLHFRTETTKTRQKWHRFEAPVLSVLLFLCLSLVARFSYEQQKISPLRQTQNKLEQQDEKLATQLSTVQDATERKETLRTDITALRKLRRKGIHLNTLIRDISSTLPESLHLTTLEYSSETASCNAPFCLRGTTSYSLKVTPAIINTQLLEPLKDQYAIKGEIVDMNSNKSGNKTNTTFIIGLRYEEMDSQE